MQTNALLRLTARELWAKRITPGVFIVSTLGWLMLTFALNLDVVDGSLAAVRIFGDQVELEQEYEYTNPETGEVEEGVNRPFGTNPLEGIVVGVQAFVAGMTYWLGLLLALFGTSSLVTGLQERGTVDLMLSKPLSRTKLLGGRLLGVWTGVFLLILYLMGAVWLVMSIKSGIWNADFLVAIGVIVATFAAMYGVITLVSVWTNSTPLALILTYGLIFASIVLGFKDQFIDYTDAPWKQLLIGLYHLLPNFSEVTEIVVQLAQGKPVGSWMPFWETVLFGAACYALAFRIFQKKDF